MLQVPVHEAKIHLSRLLAAVERGAADFTRTIVARGYVPLAITTDHAQEAGALPMHHRDPFDRMLIAQSRAERMPLVSSEAMFEAYGVVRIW